ncbi:MAG: TrbM/KikA/MpfK family conjugal transfer protein [Neisseria sp.]|uniref:TrbM/KikA/MpfK family conjugal transfer protein n=1 Tax=Neisseria sp. TaxID=192066 RepID=UPI0026DB05F3|nr:TrbM/KikA/MpfK family conjugal transfer protein [Neisseria sp.]MDO4641687.1 TrbM/KikA/MpfK family conjugal transfer protein [Neisseria sp.]
MRRYCIPAALMAALLFSPTVQAEDLLTGDAKLACEATLCLSSGDRPSECEPSIRRYFEIKHKKLHKTLKARRNFLKLCPANEEENMPALVNALVNGAGRCDAADLNRANSAFYIEQVSDKTGRIKDRVYTTRRVPYIRNERPDYCRAYFEHGWTTVADKVKYVGEEKKGGRWVDVK